VMAEYYFQHADHCYRMMMEEGYRPQTQQQQQEAQQQENAQQNGEPQQQQHQQQPTSGDTTDETMPAGALPSFLTMGYTAAAGAANTQQAEANPAQGNWEEN